MPRFVLPPLSSPAALAVFAAAVALSACGGNRPADQGDMDASTSIGLSCSFDSDCVPPGPPTAICSSEGTCIEGCAQTGCGVGLTCKASTGHCVASGVDGGVNDGGTTDGGVTTTDGGVSDGGGASATLCGTCTTNSDCQDNGLCISDPTHTYTYCTQDCTNTACPTNLNGVSYLCTTDSTNTHHQCIPSGGSCPNQGAGDGGTSGDGGVTTGSGGPTDPTNPSTNGNGVDQCNGCNVNNDCIVNAICLNSSNTGADDGYCAQQCNASNVVSLLGISIYTDCVSSECLNDLFSFDFSDAVVDCAINYSICGPIDGTTQTFCSAALGTCGPASGT